MVSIISIVKESIVKNNLEKPRLLITEILATHVWHFSYSKNSSIFNIADLP